MSVFTMPVEPGRAAAPEPVPWRNMIWVTWRQHRGLLIDVLTAPIVAAAGMPALG